MRHRLSLSILLAFAALVLLAPAAQAQTPNDREFPGRVVQENRGGVSEPRSPRGVPDIGIDIKSDDPSLSRSVVLILLFTVGSVAPAILLLMTCFTRFIVVLSLARHALGLQTTPPTQVLIGLALFMTFFAMNPVLSEINDRALQPALAGEISTSTALSKGFEPLREYMLKQTKEDDLRLFTSLASDSRPEDAEDVPASALIPAFVVSELRTAFLIGFVVFVPFLVIDLVVATALMSLGMVMVPPVVMSLPIKLLLFVLVDGWGLLVRSVLSSVTGGG